MKKEDSFTWQLPWLTSVQVNLNHSIQRGHLIGNSFVEVVADQLLISGVEPKSWGQCGLYVS